MKVDLDNLNAFYLTAKLGSITSAARELGVQQPSVSRRIKLLEDHYGALFVRGRDGMKLSNAGVQLFLNVGEIFERLYALDESVSSSSALRIGLHESLTHSIFPKIVTEELKLRSMTVVTGPVTELCHRLIQGGLDIVFALHTAEESSGIELYGEVAVDYAIFAKKPPAIDKPIRFIGMKGAELIKGAKKTGVFDEFKKIYPKASALLTTNSTSLAKQLAASGWGCALLPCFSVTQEDRLEVVSPNIKYRSRLRIYVSNRRKLDTEARAIIKAIKSHINQIG